MKYGKSVSVLVGYRSLSIAALLLGVVLRVALTSMNFAANDDHMSVIDIIATEHRIPVGREQWEAFQPKLYHVTVAAPLTILPEMTELARTRLAQFVSCAAGILTLLLLWFFLRRFPVSEWARTLTFSLVALNPKLIAISAQATNDAFVILTATAAVFFSDRFFSAPGTRTLLPLLGFSILAAMSKGNGLVVATAVVVTLVITIVRGEIDAATDRRRAARHLVVFVVAFMIVAPVLGGYWTNYRVLGSPFALNMDVDYPLPDLVENTYYGRPGITSVVDGFLTFRFLSLLREPYITQGKEYPLHRRSYWSQLFGRTYFVHYTRWPRPWASSSPRIAWLGRIVFVVALIPAMLLVLGVLRAWGRAAASVVSIGGRSVGTGEIFYAVCSGGYIAFGILYGYMYRDFSMLKVIFLFPALAIFALYGMRQLDTLYQRRLGPLCRLVAASIGALCVLHVVDVSLLIRRLVFLN